MPSSSPRASQFIRDPVVTRSGPSIKETGTLRPSAEWYPAWMQYRRREDNYVFWQDKFMRCSTDIPCRSGWRGKGYLVVQCCLKASQGEGCHRSSGGWQVTVSLPRLPPDLTHLHYSTMCIGAWREAHLSGRGFHPGDGVPSLRSKTLLPWRASPGTGRRACGSFGTSAAGAAVAAAAGNAAAAAAAGRHRMARAPHLAVGTTGCGLLGQPLPPVAAPMGVS